MNADLKSLFRPACTAAASVAVVALLAAVVPVASALSPTVPPSGSQSDLIPKVKPATPNDLEFRPGALTLVQDAGSGQNFWVFTYVIANKTGKSQRFSPRLELLMGDGTILEAGKDVPVDAARRLQRLVASSQAVDQFQIMGDILDGEANARDGFVIWPAKGDMKEITLFVSGMSSAFDRRKDPATGKDVIVRRSWSRSYALKGTADAHATGNVASFDSSNDAWLMR